MIDRPIVCLVADAPWRDRFSDAVDAGINLIHVRDRQLSARELTTLATAAVRAAAGSRTIVVINDRVDVALACGAHGVHLRADGPPVSAVRDIAPPGWLIGRSAHSAEELQRAAGADYVIFGTVFESASKPGAAGQGIAALAAAVRAMAPCPVIAIGGIDVATAAECAAAGAAGVAAISLFDRSDSHLTQLVVRLRLAFRADAT